MCYCPVLVVTSTCPSVLKKDHYHLLHIQSFIFCSFLWVLFVRMWANGSKVHRRIKAFCKRSSFNCKFKFDCKFFQFSFKFICRFIFLIWSGSFFINLKTYVGWDSQRFRLCSSEKNCISGIMAVLRREIMKFRKRRGYIIGITRIFPH